MKIRFALLGAGRIGQVHAKAITSNPQAQLVAVADVYEDRAKSLIATFGGEFRDISKDNRKHDSSQQRSNHEPGRTKNGLLELGDEVTSDKEVD